MEQFTQLGIAGASLLVLLLVLRQNDQRNKERDNFFIQAIEKKDAQIQQLTDKFSETVNSHLTRENEMMMKVTGVLDQHTQVLAGHTQVLGDIFSGMKSVELAATKIKYGRRRSDKLTN